MMEKMVPPMSQSTSQKFDVKHNGLEEDRVSKLPDEILVSVLSVLTIKEAARTCVLSHRWKNLWQLVTGSLNFDASETIWEIMQEHRSLKVARFRYVGWVNRVLEFHRGSCVEEFRVCFDLNKRSKCYVDKWVRIAIAKRAERLELDLSPYFCDNPPVRYSFPEECVMSCKSVSGLPYTGLLKSLCLKYVNVSGYFLEYLISNCPLLERLNVAGSEDVQNLKIVGSSMKLKYLDISRCFSLKSVEIFAPNLVSFKYSGETIALNIGCAPELRDLSICGSFFHPITYAICAFSSYLSQLETLTLGFCIVEEDLELPQFPELTDLKQMTWRIHACDGRSLLGLTSLLEASPFLHTFKLELIWMEPRKQRRIKKVKAYPNENLKVVEVIGFVGHTIDIELALYLLETAPMLEKFVINPRRPCRLGRIWESKETDDSETIKKSAQLLEKNLPPGAKLIIL